jgi:hypothetical protein
MFSTKMLVGLSRLIEVVKEFQSSIGSDVIVVGYLIISHAMSGKMPSKKTLRDSQKVLMALAPSQIV